MTPVFTGRRTIAITAFVLVAVAITLLAMMTEHASAQGSPFGGPRPGPSTLPASGIAGWILAKQSEFYRQFSGLIRAAKSDGSAALSLMGLSFLYGIFHAAGPGHGKAVISSYLVANGETWRRGVALSFASALLQAIVAVALVGIAAALLNLTASRMNTAVNAIESVSYALIVAVGLRLMWVKGRAFVVALRCAREPASEVGAAVTHRCDHHHHHDDYHAHSHAADRRCEGAHSHHSHECDHASAWGHAHAPEPKELAGPGGWRRGLSAIVAVGLRPCSGAILVLVFALAQGLFWVGVGSAFMMGLGTFLTVAAIATIAVGASTWAKHIATARSGFGMLAMRGVEVAAASLITGFGVLLLGGYVASERMIGF